MNHKLKALGLAFVAALAMSAVAASAATAQDHYSAPQAPTVGTGTDHADNFFTTDAGQTTCTHSLFKGTAAADGETDLTATPTYTGCTAFGLHTEINMNGCYYTFTTPTSISSTDYTMESPHVICPEGKVAEVKPTLFGGTVCTVTVPPQTPTSGHVIGREITDGGVRSVTLESTVTGIHYTVDGGGGLCGPQGGTTTNGSYTGPVTLRGYQDTSSLNDFTHNNVREPIGFLNT